MTNRLSLGSGLHDWALRRQDGVHGPLDELASATGSAVRDRVATGLVRQAQEAKTTPEDDTSEPSS